jgi:hypothetical protein
MYRDSNNLKKQGHRPIRMKRETGLNHATLTKAFSADVEHAEYRSKLKRCIKPTDNLQDQCL